MQTKNLPGHYYKLWFEWWNATLKPLHAKWYVWFSFAMCSGACVSTMDLAFRGPNWLLVSEATDVDNKLCASMSSHRTTRRVWYCKRFANGHRCSSLALAQRRKARLRTVLVTDWIYGETQKVRERERENEMERFIPPHPKETKRAENE